MNQDEKNFCTLYIVRHGETEGNVQDIIVGQSDSPLTEQGVGQAHTVANELQHIAFDAIFSSDLPRAQRTAEIIKLDREIAVQTSKLLREHTYGHYEGKPWKNLEKELSEEIKKREMLSEEAWWHHRLTNDMETFEESATRFITQLREIAVAYPGKTVLVVSHGGCMRRFLLKLGYATREELPVGALKNGGFLKVLTNGIDFILKEAKGVEKKII